MLQKNSVIRARVLSLMILIFAVVIIGRLYSLQIVNGANYLDRANDQYSVPSGDKLSRGSIYFQDKNGYPISAATLKTGFRLVIQPVKIIDDEIAYSELSKVVKLNREDFLYRASKKDDPHEVVAHKLDEDTADKVLALGIAGTKVESERWRFYPGRAIASHTLGFIAYKGDDLAGRYGLERQYENILAKNQKELYKNFFVEIFSGIAESIENRSIARSGDIYTTIEPSVQAYLEGILADVNSKWSSKKTLGIIINPQNGEIYAMGLTPSFDLNNFSEVANNSVFDNPFVERVYEMGSIIKPLTMAAGLDAGVVTAETTYDDKGFLVMDSARISNYDGKGRGIVNMQEVLNQSLNTGVSFVASKLGHENFKKYFYGFGLGKKTGIDLPGEVEGLISNLESTRDIEYATASFGQGIAISPIMTVRALSALGNGGKLITPHLGSKIEYDIGFSKEIEFPEPFQVIKPETSEEITRMLVRVVDEALLGGTVKMDNYSIAAKTGTAQIPSPNGGYYDDRYLHSFFGYFPAYNPKFLVFLMTIEPVGVRYASETLTLPFIDITKFLINYYEIPPDRGMSSSKPLKERL